MSDMVSLLKSADEIIKVSPLFKRFIKGTPLENDIAVMMAEFARDYAAPIIERHAVLVETCNGYLDINTRLRHELERVKKAADEVSERALQTACELDESNARISAYERSGRV